MPLPKHPFSKLDATLALSEFDAKLGRLSDPLGFSGTAINTVARASQLSPLAGLPDHVRQMVEGKGLYAGHLDMLRSVMSTLGPSPAMSESVRQLVGNSGPYASHLDWIRTATATHGLSAALTGVQTPFLKQMEALRQATGAVAGPYLKTVSAAFADTNVYTGHLNAVRQATATLAGMSPMQDALRLATREMPDWLKPRTASDMLLPSWMRTAQLGIFGVATPGLVHDVLGSLHRQRADTVAFDVAASIAESFDDLEGGPETTADLLQRVTAALIALCISAKDYVARQGIINLLTLIVALGAYYDSHLSRLDADEQTALARAAASPEPTPAQQEIARQLQTIEATLREQGSEYKAERNRRVVIQSAPLRLAPEARATVIRIVYPDDRVRVQEVKDGWARVEVFDYASEATVAGWISRRVLRVPSGG